MKKELNIKNDCTGMFPVEIVDTILESRGIKDVEHFLNPNEDDLLPLDSLYRIDEAVQLFIDGIVNNKKFFILYDSDVDGCCSGTIINRYLKSMNAEVDWTINHGKIHGCNDYVLKKIKESQPDIVIIVDSLDATTEYYEAICNRGCKIIVLDHHELPPNMEEEYDKYTILVSSNRRYKNPALSGSGTCFKFVKAIDNVLGTIEADEFWDLAAVGILADVMNVDEEHKENRYIVHKGLSNLNNLFIKKIIGSYQFDSQAVLFSVAPLINSANRYDENEAAALVLLSDDNKEILKYSRILKGCKEKQANEVNELLPDLIEQCENQNDMKLLFCVVETDSGISGLLATKLVEMYKKQVIVVKETKTGYAGSARAIGVDFKDLCVSTECGEFQGHLQAHGVILPYYKYDEFREKMEKLLSDVELKQEINVDAELSVGDINEDLISDIKKINRISGNGFRPINFAISVDDFEVEMVGEKQHMVATVGQYGKFQFVKWNAKELVCEEMEDYALCNDIVTFIGTLDVGFLNRCYCQKLIVNDIVVN